MKKSIPYKISPIDFDLRQLEIFCRVVELASFSKAADAVFLAQSSVSERISTLERMVGTKLIDRLGRNVVPTKSGKLLYKQAIRLLEIKKGICLEMQAFLGIKQGNVHIGGSTIPGEYILPGVIGHFREKYSHVSVTLTIGNSSEIEGKVLEGKLELGIVGSKNHHKNLVRYRLWEDELVLAIPSQHRWAKRQGVSIKELLEQPFILRKEGSGTLKIMEKYLHASGSKGMDFLDVVARFGTSTSVKEGIKGGLGVSILSSRALNTELETGILKALRIDDLPMTRSFFLITDNRRSVSPLCRAMIDFLLTTSNKNKLVKPEPVNVYN